VVNSPNASTVAVPNVAGSFQFIAQQTSFKPIKQLPFFGSAPFFVLLAFPVILLLLYFIIRSQTPDAMAIARRHKARLVKKFLGKAKKNMSEASAFYVSLEAALHNYLKARLQIQTDDFSKEKMQTLLSDKGVEKDTVALFIQVLTNCELARYAPSSRSSMEQDYETAVAAITQMDKQFKS
jgi:hypothetical protein